MLIHRLDDRIELLIPEDCRLKAGSYAELFLKVDNINLSDDDDTVGCVHLPQAGKIEDILSCRSWTVCLRFSFLLAVTLDVIGQIT